MMSGSIQLKAFSRITSHFMPIFCMTLPLYTYTSKVKTKKPEMRKKRTENWGKGSFYFGAFVYLWAYQQPAPCEQDLVDNARLKFCWF